MPFFIINLDKEAISDLQEVADRLMHLDEYCGEDRSVAMSDLVDALLHYWLIADFDRLNLMLDDLKQDRPLFRDGEIIEAFYRLANPHRSGYRDLNSSSMDVQRQLLEIDEIITYDVKVDTFFNTIGFGIY
jgi:hypothetical protein